MSLTYLRDRCGDNGVDVNSEDGEGCDEGLHLVWIGLVLVLLAEKTLSLEITRSFQPPFILGSRYSPALFLCSCICFFFLVGCFGPHTAGATGSMKGEEVIHDRATLANVQ